MRTFLGCLMIIFVVVIECRSQEVSSGSSSELASLVAGEVQRGVYVFYTQSFMDKENKQASYRGSVYGAMQRFEVSGCELKIETVIVDKFSGTVGRASTGELQDTYRYSARFLLTPEIAAGLAVIEARPAQLGHNTHSVCSETPSCDFSWLRIQATSRVIHENSSVNNAQDFNGQVDHFVVPLSSGAIGRHLIEDMRAMAESRCK